MLQLASLLMMVYSFVLIEISVGKLPARIPTHFNAAGNADGWGSPDTLWVLLLAQVVTGLIFVGVPLIGQRWPQAVNLGTRRLSDFTPEQQARILPLLRDMTGYMSVLLNLFFVVMLRQIIAAATAVHPHLFVPWPLGIMLAGFVLITVYYLRRIFRVAKEPAERHSSLRSIGRSRSQ